MHVLEADPRESFAFTRLLDLYRERDGNVDGLIRELEERLGRDEDDYAARVLLGHVLKAQGRAADARAAYERAHALRPDALPPLLSLAAMAAAENDHAGARARYQEALTHVRETAERQEILRSIGAEALAMEDWDGARDAYAELARGAASSVYLITEYARALAERNQHERAIAEYERVIARLRGDNRVLGPVLRELGEAQLAAGDADAAIETLGRALSTAGRASGVRAEIYDTLLEAYRRTDRLPELVQRLEHEGRGFETAELLGRIHDELGDEAEALAAYRRALATDARNIDIRVRVIQLLTRSGRIDDVIAEYEALIRTAPREPRFVVELAQLLMQVGRREEALRRAEQTGRAHPREPSVHQALAELYSRWGEEELSAREIATLARIEPNDPAHLVALGSQRLEAGDRTGAIATWRRILEADSDHARAHATLGGVYADHDMLEEAAREYEEAVRIDGDELDVRPRARERPRAPPSRRRGDRELAAGARARRRRSCGQARGAAADRRDLGTRRPRAAEPAHRRAHARVRGDPTGHRRGPLPRGGLQASRRRARGRCRAGARADHLARAR